MIEGRLPEREMETVIYYSENVTIYAKTLYILDLQGFKRSGRNCLTVSADPAPAGGYPACRSKPCR